MRETRKWVKFLSGVNGGSGTDIYIESQLYDSSKNEISFSLNNGSTNFYYYFDKIEGKYAHYNLSNSEYSSDDSSDDGGN